MVLLIAVHAHARARRGGRGGDNGRDLVGGHDVPHCGRARLEGEGIGVGAGVSAAPARCRPRGARRRRALHRDVCALPPAHEHARAPAARAPCVGLHATDPRVS